MKDNTTQKFLLAIAVFAAVGFAVWTGLATNVEAPVAATQQGAFSTPF